MDFNQLKELAKKLGGILVMNGKTPDFVILPFEKYQKMEAENPTNSANISEEEEAMVERLNKEIQALKEEIRLKEEAELAQEEEEVQIDESEEPPKD